MKRRALKLFMLLLAGAIINIAVAWGCAMWSPTDTTTLPNSASVYEQIQFGRTIYGTRLIVRRDWQLSGVSADGRHVYERNPSLEPIAFPHSISAGWPLRSLIGSFSSVKSQSQPLACVVLPEPLCMFSASRDIPIDPLWPGFAINTIFYAAIVWSLFFAPAAIRRRVRRKRGQCAACGYSLRGNSSEKCPECGAVVSMRSTA